MYLLNYCMEEDAIEDHRDQLFCLKSDSEVIWRNDAVVRCYNVLLEPHLFNVWPMHQTWQEIFVEHHSLQTNWFLRHG